MASEADICNLALSRIGVKAYIDDLDDTSRIEAVVCKTLYVPNRDALLGMIPWPFAEGETSLGAPLTTTREGWLYAYALPNDCVQPRRLITPGVSFPTSAQRVPFKIGYDAALGPLLFTNQAESILVYTVRIIDTLRFEPNFVDCLAWKIAADAAMALAVKGDFEQACRQRFTQALGNAAAIAFSASQDEGEPVSDLITVRY